MNIYLIQFDDNEKIRKWRSARCTAIKSRQKF